MIPEEFIERIIKETGSDVECGLPKPLGRRIDIVKHVIAETARYILGDFEVVSLGVTQRNSVHKCVALIKACEVEYD